mmetsp:Transcript_88878/g.251984  ORF Transcript_88878/g.251984 Transcript_88878/m.251984 type:complete len:349 (-) Transcript_88878:26-1072(-)
MFQLALGYHPVTVLVEDAEGIPAGALQLDVPGLQRRREELRVVDHTAPVGVDVLHDLLQVLGELLQAGALDARLHLLDGEEAVVVPVQLQEGLPERLDLLVVQLPGDDVQGRLLELVLRAEGAEAVDEVGPQVHLRRLRRRVLDPDVAQRLLRGVPLFGVHLQEVADEALRVVGDTLPIGRVEGEVPQSHLGQHFRVSLTVKRWVPAKHDVHDDPAAPQVARVVVPAAEHLRSDVVGRAGLRCKLDVWRDHAGEAEVDDLQDVRIDTLLLRLEEEVLRLQVAVADPVLVHVVDGTNHLLHDDRDLGLLEVALRDDVIEELAAAAKLHDQVYVLGVHESLVELDNARVV